MMATVQITDPELIDIRQPMGLGPLVNQMLAPIASLKLTVALFAMSIFLIMASTLAQVDKDIWQVIGEYYQVSFAWIEFQLFLPPSFWRALFDAPPPQVPGGIYFPGGYLIGGLMALNLLAAHLVRFQAQARGWRLVSGLLVILAGMVLTTLIVLASHNPAGLQGEAWISYRTLWWLFLAGLTGSCAVSAYGWWRLAPDQHLSRWLLAAAVLLQGALVGYLYSRGGDGRLSDSAMRILWQLTQGGLAAAVLLVGCILVFKKRAGIVLLHGGVGLLMFGGLLVDQTAVEGQIQMQEGETVNFVQDIRTLEFAVVDRSSPEEDRVTVIPKSVLVAAADSKQPIDHELLPFKIKVERFLQNSSLRKVKPGDKNPATVGLGTELFAEETRPGSGTDSDSKVDLSAAYVTILRRAGSVSDRSPDSEESLGTYLVGLIFSAEESGQTVTVADKPYEIALRFKRTYKPYKFQLLDVRKDDYLGTDTPRNYSSDVRLVDASRNVDRELRIWMNNPLRFAGETFYQSGYHQDPQTRREGTTLAVVTNTGWMIPYISCMFVMIGMLAHFSITLWRFLRRMEGGERSEVGGRRSEVESQSPVALALNWALPLGFAVIGAIVVLAAARPAMVKENEFDFAAFGRLPVVADGRAKPIDTLARSSLLVLSSRQYYEDHNERTQPAVRWLLDVIARPKVAFTHRAFRIDNLEVQELLGLERRERFRYAPEEFLPQLDKLTEQSSKAHDKDPAEITVYDKKVLELERKLGVLDLLLQSFSPPEIRPESARDDLMMALARQESLKKRHPPLVVPPIEADGSWETFSAAWTRSFVNSTFRDQEPDEPTEAMTRILVAYAKDDPQTFNKEVTAYRDWLAKNAPAESNLTRTDFEAFFNGFQPFTIARGLYVAAFVLAAIGWLAMSFHAATPFQRSAAAVALVALGVHTFALVARMYISGRPPVTNLYSSAVFIGWGAALLSMVMNLFFRHGVGTTLAAAAGFITLGIANHLAADGDTFIVLQAVLDTQFWLATHVTCITLGYATTYLAGFLGLLYVFLGLLTPALDRDLGRDLNKMTYGALCFSIFFSFVGTVLGGLWADDSWGRFWGWDPKENGALMIVLWNALVLHARWGAMIRERGLALLAILGNIFVSWSWFGVNELGVGLHAYGFREGMVFWLCVGALIHLGVVAAGLVPQKHWVSTLANGPSRRPT
jgi:ABC-type transport system involved in cytochrome c biogenesis permease subunit